VVVDGQVRGEGWRDSVSDEEEGLEGDEGGFSRVALVDGRLVRAGLGELVGYLGRYLGMS